MSQLENFNKLYNEYKDRFIRIAKTYVVDEMVAEDIVMDSFIYFWENRERLPKDLNSPAYIMTTVKHKCINHLRKQKLRKGIEERLKTNMEWKLKIKIATLEACNPDDLFTSEIQNIINNTLTNLSSKTRNIFTMSRVENKTYQDIANYYGITTKGVEFHIRKALKVLRSDLRDYLPLFFFLFF